MSAVLDNAPDDIVVLEGATIESIWIEKMEQPFYDKQTVIRMRVRFAEDTVVNGMTHGEYELWQDGEGNGPGYLAFVQEG